MIKVITIVTGMLEENCYIIHNDIDALIVDPGDNSDIIISEIEKLNLNVKGILITHYHFDHVGALDDIKAKYPNAVLVDYKTKEDKLQIGTFEFKKIETLVLLKKYQIQIIILI